MDLEVRHGRWSVGGTGCNKLEPYTRNWKYAAHSYGRKAVTIFQKFPNSSAYSQWQQAAPIRSPELYKFVPPYVHPNECTINPSFMAEPTGRTYDMQVRICGVILWEGVQVGARMREGEWVGVRVGARMRRGERVGVHQCEMPIDYCRTHDAST